MSACKMLDFNVAGLANLFFGRTADSLREGSQAIYGAASGTQDTGTPIDFFTSLIFGGLVNDDKTSMGQAAGVLRGFASMVPAFRPFIVATAIPEAAMEAWRGDFMDAASALVNAFGIPGLGKCAQFSKEIAEVATNQGMKAAACKAGSTLGSVAPRYHDSYRGFVDSFKTSFATGKAALGTV